MVIDSHVLLWWLEAPSLLSDRAAAALRRIETGESGFLVSSVTFWELRIKEVRGLLEPKTSVRQWPRLLGKIENLQVLDVGPDLWMRAAELEWSHRDPADRILASTALRHGVPMLTKDRLFHAPDSPVPAVW